METWWAVCGIARLVHEVDIFAAVVKEFIEDPLHV